MRNLRFLFNRAIQPSGGKQPAGINRTIQRSVKLNDFPLFYLPVSKYYVQSNQMKKIYWNIAIILLVLIGIGGTVLGTTGISAAGSVWNSCTRGRVNCPYPGECRDYIDTNKDKICDRSQSNPAAATTTVVAAASTQTTPTGSTAAVQTTTVPATPTASAAPSSAVANPDITLDVPEVPRRTYNLVPVLLLSAFLYGLTWILAARKKMTVIAHRKIWNTALLIYALVSCLLGILLVVRIETGFELSLPFDLLFWHVEAGIAMSLISLFHVVWHRKYFIKLFNKARVSPVESPSQKLT
jgi:hypothetical protein